MHESKRRLPILYSELADWWPILSAPEDYEEEARFYWDTILSHSKIHPRNLLELGSGGGNNASHLKEHVELTLVDVSPGMLEVSERLNPGCAHVQGDMRSIRLEQEFDAVFIHDAIVYMTSIEDLKLALTTAFVHCRPGGVALFAPDFTGETFRLKTEHGGHDASNRSLRYLDWTWDPDPDDSEYYFDMVYVLRDSDDEVRCIHDRHHCGLFSRYEWLNVINEIGFLGKRVPFEHSEETDQIFDVFLGLKP